MNAPTNTIMDLKNRLASQASQQQAAQASQQEPKQEQVEEREEIASTLRIFWGEFPTHQNYLTKLGKTVAFYKGYCMTDDPEIIECIKTIREVKEVTGQVKESDVPSPAKRERNRNWAAAQGTQPHVMNPAELLMRAANIANSTHITQSARSDSSV